MPPTLDELRDRFMQAESPPTNQNLVDLIDAVKRVEAESIERDRSIRQSVNRVRDRPGEVCS